MQAPTLTTERLFLRMLQESDFDEYSAFDEMKKTRVISLIDPQNVASIRVAEKIGERLSDERFVTGGHELLVYEARRA
jgi:RimJ/RimL family protein N-acetyltransferase